MQSKEKDQYSTSHLRPTRRNGNQQNRAAILSKRLKRSLNLWTSNPEKPFGRFAASFGKINGPSEDSDAKAPPSRSSVTAISSLRAGKAVESKKVERKRVTFSSYITIVHLMEPGQLQREPKMKQTVASDDKGVAMSDRGGRVSPFMTDLNRIAIKFPRTVPSVDDSPMIIYNELAKEEDSHPEASSNGGFRNLKLFCSRGCKVIVAFSDGSVPKTCSLVIMATGAGPSDIKSLCLLR